MKKIFEAIFILFLLTLLAGCAGGLHSAAERGDIKAINNLIDNGADVNERIDGPRAAGPPLFNAVYSCQLEAVKCLIGRGANVNAPCFDNKSALHYAVENDCVKVAKFLIDNSANINARCDEGGIAPLAYAASRDSGESVKLLLEMGADADVAIRQLSKIRRNDAAQIVEQTVKRLREGKAQIASNSDSGTSGVKSDIDELPAIKTKQNKNAYAIVIGIEQYRQKLPKANFATQDAKLVADYLIKVMGYPEKNVIMLLNDRASYVDFSKYFVKWLPNNVGNESSVFIYFSGHGAPNPKTGDAYLVPYDGDPSFIAETGYSLKTMYDALGKLPAKEIVVVLDSCFSGAGGRSVLAKGARPLVMNISGNLVLSKNMKILSASSGEQISSTYDEKGHGLFTYFMLKGIKTENVVNPDGSIKIDDLFGYVKPQVERIARKQYNNEQTPQLITSRKD